MKTISKLLLGAFLIILSMGLTYADTTPSLTDVSIVSSNAYSGSLAKYGDFVTLSFTGSEVLSGVTVKFDNNSAFSVSGTGNTWVATSQDINSGSGMINFTIDYLNLSGTTGSTVIGTTNGTSVTIDNTLPTTSVNYSTASPTSSSVVATLTGASEDIVITNNSGSNLYTFSDNGSFVFEYRDMAGNLGHTIAIVNNINHSAPIITLNGSGTINVLKGTSYTELGATWSDQIDGTGTVSTISGSVDINTIGVYLINYIKVNSLGITGSTNRTVNVVNYIPVDYYFTSLTGKELSTIYSSNTVNIGWIGTGTTISIVGGEYKIGNGNYTSLSGIINPGESVTLRLISSNLYNTLKTATLTIGGIGADFNVTTKVEPIPGGGTGTTNVCTLDDLVCKAHSNGVYKLYKKDGVSCVQGDFWKNCTIINGKTIVLTPNRGISKYISKNHKLNWFSLKLDSKINRFNQADQETIIALRNDLIVELENYINAIRSGNADDIKSTKQSILDIYKNLNDEIKYMNTFRNQEKEKIKNSNKNENEKGNNNSNKNNNGNGKGKKD
nr:DUF5011 domain-containing protein [Candidatus Gracilibacteria bacterium]